MHEVLRPCFKFVPALSKILEISNPKAINGFYQNHETNNTILKSNRTKPNVTLQK